MSRLGLSLIIKARNFATKVKVHLDSEICASFDKEEFKYRKHPGIVRPKSVFLPKWVLQAIKDVFQNVHDKKKVIEDAKTLSNILNYRKPPPDNEEIEQKVTKVEKILKTKYGLTEVDIENHKKGKLLLKQNLYNWKPLNYDDHLSLVYLIARATENYTVTYKVFQEINAINPNFKPKSIFDFGSGIGTVSWAASQMWSSSLKEYLCVDTSAEMNELFLKLIKHAEPQIRTVYLRQFFPASPIPKFDIVVSAFSLMELPDINARLDVILRLWRKTEHYLVIIEKGSFSGYKLVNEARDFVLNNVNSRNERDPSPAYVLAPCPHDLDCPVYETRNFPCSFQIYYQSLPKKSDGVSKGRYEKFSYVVLAKGERPVDDKQWPRIIRPVLKRSKHVICRMCTASGEFQESIISKKPYKGHVYRCAKVSEWGDRIPMNFEKIEVDERNKVKMNEENLIDLCTEEIYEDEKELNEMDERYETDCLKNTKED
ncbi:ribosome assembly protein METTL17, mitochondrial [Prorops nasuta]|uniref:ribosome assembly protein METTL17, mitochondrial n=1 Tax=Prorops nasuta TaxID=863751 RepID=UPI0034CD1B18